MTLTACEPGPLAQAITFRAVSAQLVLTIHDLLSTIRCAERGIWFQSAVILFSKLATDGTSSNESVVKRVLT